MPVSDDVMQWMLDSDPMLRWRVECDLAGEPREVWEATRARVATEGIGAQLLAHQDADGQWAGGAYFPADFDFDGPEAADDAGQPWTATTWTLSALREGGLDAAVLEGTTEKLEANARWEYDDLPYWGGEVDACINGWTLANGAWLGRDMGRLADWFAEHEMAEGGWNCEWVDGSTRASVHSTINALVSILEWEQRTGDTRLRDARHRAEEYLLRRRILYRESTGELLGPWVLRFAWPFRWRHTALRAVDYFRQASLHDGTPPDPRLVEAVSVVRDARESDGTWVQERRYPGRVWVELDVPVGERSPWLTYCGTLALDWWDGAQQP